MDGDLSTNDTSTFALQGGKLVVNRLDLSEVDTIRVVPAAVVTRARVSGVLEPRSSVQIFAETRGPVIAIGAEALDRVEAGLSQLAEACDPSRPTEAYSTCGPSHNSPPSTPLV